MILRQLLAFLDGVFPAELAESWDNVGLLVGDRDRAISRVLTCLTVTPEVVEEAIARGAGLVVSHHPFPFLAEKRWTADTPAGRLLSRIMRADLAIYSPHTAHDSALCGINEQIAHRLELTGIRALYPGKVAATREMLEGGRFAALGFQWEDRVLGTGRIGTLPKRVTIEEFAAKIRVILRQQIIPAAYPDGYTVETVAIGCGAADDFVKQAVAEGADVLLVGEARFHRYLDALALGIALVAPGHYATERFAMETLAERIASVFPELDVFPSRAETDPVRFFV